MAKAMNFSLYVDDPERAVKFYSEVLGWKMQKFPGAAHYMIDAGPAEEQGVSGFMEPRVGNREKDVKNRSTVLHIRVSSYEDTINKIIDAGGKVLDDFPMGDMGHHATCQDTEGNVFAIMWENPNAKVPAKPQK
jgi:uncharacterized protein